MVWVLGFSSCPWRSLARPLPQEDAASEPSSLTKIDLGFGSTPPLTRPRDREAFPGEASLESSPRGGGDAGSIPKEKPGPKRPRTAQDPELLAEAALQEVFRAVMALRRSVFVSGHRLEPTTPCRSVARAFFPIDAVAHLAPPLPVRACAAEDSGAPSDGGKGPRGNSGKGGVSRGGQVVDDGTANRQGSAPTRSKK